MTTIVSYSEFRENLSKYFSLLKKKGSEIVIKDARNGKELIRLVATEKKKIEFDWDEHIKFVESIGGKLFTDEDVKAIKELRKRSKERAKRLNW
ncbi:MAG: hypothetical protein US96_C0014G0023 [Candidatus Woesebacteria bacterium GW2011_GWB1_38_5b]|uniref:Uncharacterized protein n=1 Tax=Candidatus Woesebacteria bacterium GW2011_GWB1_38_5b TaxID=1618569 RepID=A0A0G0KIC7_9BACT|nr:MAG: hypothetical protein US96_C0014G0023 [Candidatus Woesebacteria bacterium GW2011_GWB1_38_5b]